MITDARTNTTESRNLLYLNSTKADDLLPDTITENGWRIDLARDPDEANELIGRENYSVGLVRCDGSSADINRLEKLAEGLNDANSRANFVALVSNGADINGSLASTIAKYFYSYHTCPIDANRLLVTLGQAYGMAKVANGVVSSTSANPNTHGMLGESRPIKSLMRKVERVANTDLNVLIRGESGTGKELTAEAIHRMSKRADGPFVPVNCGALPRDLIQTELFGHEKGAFTGADRSHIGRIESARNGTLFLDEIGDLPLELQTNLLRFLQQKSIERVGNTGQIFIDVRVVAATNVNLEEAVKKGRFREDLYYRLNVLQLEAPPLRERETDIQLLADSFFREFSSSINPSLKGFNTRAIQAIEAHNWPGNVREMINRIQRAVVMCEGKFISIRDLGLDDDDTGDFCTLAEARAKMEKETIEHTLCHMRNNVSKTARKLGISRVTLYRLMEQHAIDWQGQNT